MTDDEKVRAFAAAVFRKMAESYRVPQTPTTGLGAILGKWPGEETDEEIHAALHPDLPPYVRPDEVVE